MAAEGKTILVVDDEPDVLIFLEAWLEDEGFQAISAADAPEGLKRARNDGPDLILLDLKMPHQTGLDLYRILQQDQELRCIPVVFITGMNDIDLYDSDCTPLPPPAGRVAKPIDQRALRAILKLHL